MKQASKSKLRTPLIGESLDGPPIDFSFKSIRSLQQISEFMNTKALQTLEKQDLAENSTNTQTAEKAIVQEEKQQSQQKIQIIRTIESNGHHFLQQQQKKNHNSKQTTEKKEKKIIKAQTTALFLRYNKITSIDGFSQFISPLFPDCGKLMWIDISHNRLVSLCPDFKNYKNLKTLYMHANFIANFNEFQKLKENQTLITLTVHGNPIEQYGEFRIIIEGILPTLKKIDSTLVTKREVDRASVLIKSLKKYPVISKAHQPPQESDNQDQA